MTRFLASRQVLVYIVIFIIAAALTAAVAALLVNISQRQLEAKQYPLKVVEIPEGELDPAVWGENFPHEYDRFVKTQEDYGQTPYGGSTPYDKLERYPILKRLWAGHPFSVDYNEERCLY